MSWTAVCKVSDLADDSALGVKIGVEAVCVARSRSQIYALQDVCSHAEIALSDGDVDDGAVECWLHGSRFDLATGQPTGLPANKPVPTYPVRVEGDDVLVSLTAH